MLKLSLTQDTNMTTTEQKMIKTFTSMITSQVTNEIKDMSIEIIENGIVISASSVRGEEENVYLDTVPAILLNMFRNMSKTEAN